MPNPFFEIVKTTAGAISIRNNMVNEIMHNPVGPWKEANALYVKQSNLEKKLTTYSKTEIHSSTNEEFVVFDVGLGAAANALATLHCFKKFNIPMRLVSFEIDLELLKFALLNSHQFLHFKGYEKVVETILNEKYWESGNIVWELYEGDFLNTIHQVKHHCDLVYYDPYSPKVNQEMWSTECFKKLKTKCKDNTEFYNYSQATPIRAALLEAGFYVGYGMPIGEKNATTQAACLIKNINNPLDHRWLERWRRSHTPFPYGCKDPVKLKEVISSHSQFQGLRYEFKKK